MQQRKNHFKLNKKVFYDMNVVILYTARSTSGISEEVYDMGSYRTRLVHRAVYSLYHDNYSTCLLVA